MLAARERGDRVVVVTATRGEHGTDDPDRWPADRLGALRARELDEALTLLGVTEHRWLGYEDGTCPLVPRRTAADRVAAIVDEVRPDTIVTFADDGVTGHADHRTVGHWARRARRAAAPEAELLEAVLLPGFTRRFADINEAFGVFMDDPAAEVDPDLHLRLDGDHLEREDRGDARAGQPDAPPRRGRRAPDVPALVGRGGLPAHRHPPPWEQRDTNGAEGRLARAEQHENPLLTLPPSSVRL